MIALSVAAALAVFLLYTSAFGGGTPSLSPSQLPGHHGRVSVVGKVVGQPSGDGHEQALRFTLRDRDGHGDACPSSTAAPCRISSAAAARSSIEGRVVEGTFARDPRDARDEVPVEVRAREEARSAWPTSVAPRSSSRSGSPSTRRSPARGPRARTGAGSPTRRGTRCSRRSARRRSRAAVLLSALVRHDFSFTYVAQHTSTRAADRLLDLRVLGRPGGIAAALAARARRVRRRGGLPQPPPRARPRRVDRARARRRVDVLRVHARRRLEPVRDADGAGCRARA